MDSKQPSEEATARDIQQGLVYPPPPSYYQNMVAPAEPPPLPAKSLQPQPVQPRPPEATTRSSAQKQYDASKPPVKEMQPTYYAPGQYRDMVPPPPVRRSHRQLWVIVAIISVSALLLCGAGSWALFNVFGALYQQANTGTPVVQDFYQNLLSQNYSGAYADLQINRLTSATFIQEAQAVNSQYGQIVSFNIDTTAFNASNSAPNTTHWQVTVNVTRQYASYSVPVVTDSINGNWLITSIDLSKF
ncbi:MAG TPA: hypothetical protein VNE38_11445 [Ktedonobacteraceae bacterium]|nr:hypothetical protein [Ktedonobacteraceae bacterium]